MAAEPEQAVGIDDGVAHVREAMRTVLRRSPVESLYDELRPCLNGGKMLRGRLTLRLGSATGIPRATLVPRATFIELIHAASLLHDDLLDGGKLRRGEPSLWVRRGIKAAVVAGDMLVARAVRLVYEHAPELMPVALDVLRDMCDAEAEQELLLNGDEDSWETCVDMARRKTGGLFGLAACAGATDTSLVPLLREAGTRVGTAYQLADDILDACPPTEGVAKTLGTDSSNGILTAATAARGRWDPLACIQELLDSSRAMLTDTPEVHTAWQQYLAEDIAPAVERLTDQFEAKVGVA